MENIALLLSEVMLSVFSPKKYDIFRPPVERNSEYPVLLGLEKFRPCISVPLTKVAHIFSLSPHSFFSPYFSLLFSFRFKYHFLSLVPGSNV
jgi:hypothetical protein